MIVLSEKHLLRVLREYVRYYHGSRTHLGEMQAEPMVGGLHHRYFRHAA